MVCFEGVPLTFSVPVAYGLYRMSKVCESWSLEDLVAMNEEDMEVLLGFYKPGDVPTFESVRGENEYAFDGSFGWW